MADRVKELAPAQVPAQPAVAAPGPLPVALRGALTPQQVLALQRTAGNAAVAARLSEARAVERDRRESIGDGRRIVAGAISDAVTEESARLEVAAQRTSAAISASVATHSREVTAAGQAHLGAVDDLFTRA